MTIVIMVCVWHAVVPAIYFAWGSEVADKSDIIVAAALGAAYVLAHIVFAFVIATRVRVITGILYTHTHPGAVLRGGRGPRPPVKSLPPVVPNGPK